MKCTLHFLAYDERHAAFFVLAGLSLCAECVKQTAARMGNFESVSEIVRDAALGNLP